MTESARRFAPPRKPRHVSSCATTMGKRSRMSISRTSSAGPSRPTSESFAPNWSDSARQFQTFRFDLLTQKALVVRSLGPLCFCEALGRDISHIQGRERPTSLRCANESNTCYWLSRPNYQKRQFTPTLTIFIESLICTGTLGRPATAGVDIRRPVPIGHLIRRRSPMRLLQTCGGGI